MWLHRVLSYVTSYDCILRYRLILNRILLQHHLRVPSFDLSDPMSLYDRRPLHDGYFSIGSPLQYQPQLVDRHLHNLTSSFIPLVPPSSRQSPNSIIEIFYAVLQLLTYLLRLYPMPVLIATAILSNMLILAVMLGAHEYRLNNLRATRTIAFRYYCIFFAIGDLICIFQFIYDQLRAYLLWTISCTS